MDEEYESVQIALFVAAPVAAEALDLWKTIFGSNPAGFQTPAPGHTQAQGVASGYEATLIVQPQRLDLVLMGPAPTPPQLPPGIISDLSDAIAMALGWIEKLLPSLTVGRVAAVIQGNRFATSQSAAVDLFRVANPSVPVPAGANGVNWEITVPLASKVNPARKLVRIARWQTVQAQIFSMAPNNNSVATRYAAHSYADVYGEAMEFMQQADVISALKEVTSEAQRILVEGPNAFD